MPKPEIKPTVNGFAFSWQKGKVNIDVSRILVLNTGRVTGELFIRNCDTAIKSPFHFDFLDDARRISLAKDLDNITEGIKWRSIIDQLCHEMLKIVREGEPVVELYSGADVEPPEYILDPFIIRNYPTIIYGERGTLKTTTALVLAQIMSLPWDDNPLELTAPCKSVNVLLLDYENDHATIAWQLTMIENGMLEGCTATIHYRRCFHPLAQDLDAIKEKIAEVKADLIIVDSIGVACGGNLKDDVTAITYYSALRQLNITSISLAHPPKDQANVKSKSVFGSVFFENLARNIWEIRKSQEHDSLVADVALFHKKPAPFQSYHAPIGFRFHFTDNSIECHRNDPRDVPELLEHMSKTTKVLAYMRRENRSVSAAEISEELGFKVNRTMTDLKNTGRVVNLERGMWGLVNKEV